MKAHAYQFHKENIYIDGLNASYFLNPLVFENIFKGEVTALNGTIAAWHGYDETMEIINTLRAIVDKYQDKIILVKGTQDIYRAKADKKLGFIMGFQDSNPIGDKLQAIAEYASLGVRIIQLTYNTTNHIGSGCMVEDKGLTKFGREAIAEMNRVGILIDVSHCGPRTSMEAIAASDMPIAITHANPFALCPHPRNKSNEAIKSLANKGGVIGANAFPFMLPNGQKASIDDYLNVIDYLIDLVGDEHVALGPDFMEGMPEEVANQVLKDVPDEMRKQMKGMPVCRGFESVAKSTELTLGLFKRGYSEDAIKNIIGLNWVNLYKRTWKR